jgi:hypothetical protein
MSQINCDPNALAQAAKCFKCLSPQTNMEVQTFILAVLAGGSLDPSTLAQEAKAFFGESPQYLEELKTYLICQLAGVI